MWSAPGLTWQTALKKYWSEIGIINQYWYAVNGWKGMRGGICHAIYQYAKSNSNYRKGYDKKRESSYLK